MIEMFSYSSLESAQERLNCILRSILHDSEFIKI